MHAYRDAIRNQVGRRIVRYAAILYPGPEVRYADNIEALRSHPGAEQELTHRLGEILTAALTGPEDARGSPTVT